MFIHHLINSTLAPTVKIDISGDSSVVDYSYGVNGDGLGGWADIPANLNVNPGGQVKSLK